MTPIDTLEKPRRGRSKSSGLKWRTDAWNGLGMKAAPFERLTPSSLGSRKRVPSGADGAFATHLAASPGIDGKSKAPLATNIFLVVL